MPNPAPGTVLGAYRVETTIGSGSMGEVFRGIDTGLNRRVAIKILSEKHRDSQELRARFVREGRAVAAISHPNVVQVFATGSFDDRPYIAMELLDGTDLGSTVEKHGALSSTEAAHAALDAAQGLAAAAKAGLIHRDVKPSNLVRMSDGRVKVTDFGLAKPVDPGAEPALTAMGVVVGTPDYIAPEQARGEPIDERVDIYALGGSLYFLLAGVPPFRTGRPSEDKYLKVVARHLRNPAPDAAITNPAVDRELAALAKQMMAKKREDRPSYADIVARLTAILARLDPDSVPEIIAATRERSRPFIVLPGVGGGATVSDGALRVPRGGFPAWLVVFSIACAGLLVAGLVVYFTHDDASAATPTTGSGNATVGSAGTTTGSATGSSAALPPAGMTLVTHPDGSPWFFVDAKPVSAAAYRELFDHHTQPGPAEAPVVVVGYDEARGYARSRGGRLPRPEEWTRAAAMPWFDGGDGLFEWVESPAGSRQVSSKRGIEPRPDEAQKDVTFRVAKDL